MIKVKVTKNIIRKNEVAFGFNVSQVIVAAIGLTVGVIELIALKNVLSYDMRMTIVFITMAVFIFGGVVQINGMSVVELFSKSLKGVDKRPYNRKGVYSNDTVKK